MEFRTLTRRVAEKFGVEVPAEAPAPASHAAEPGPAPVAFDTAAYVCIRDGATLADWLATARARGWLAVDTETTSLDEMRAELVGVSLCVEAGQAAYLPLGHKSGGDDLFGASQMAPGQMPIAEALALLKPVLEDDSILKIGQNMKYDYKIFARHGIRVGPFDDTMLMSYAMHAGLHGHGMDALSEKYLGHAPIPIKSLLGAENPRSPLTRCRSMRR